MNATGFFDSLGRDLRYSLRALRRTPMFTAVALLTLGIGIGATTAVFSVVNSVLLRPLPYPSADELVALQHTAPGAPGLATASGDLRLSPSMYFTYAEQNRTFKDMGVWFANLATVTGRAEPEQVRTIAVTDGTLQALEVQPVLGRWLSKADQAPGGAGKVMLSYGYWQRRFGGETSVVGRSVTVDSQPREIVGVMPRGFRVVDTDPDLIVPLPFNRSQLILPPFAFQGVARLKPGLTIAEASADIARLIPVWNGSWPAFPGVNPRIYESWQITPALRPLKQQVIGNIASALWVLMGTIGIVLLIACANVANLLLVRADGRQHELAVRAALGAGWGRIVRELTLESVLLGLMGGALGLGIAYAGLRALVAVGPATLPRLSEISIDPRALAFTLVISLLSGLMFGLLPALKYASPRLAPARHFVQGGRTSSQSRERHRTRNILVVAQVALALVLLIGSGLMIRTFQALRKVEPGFTQAEQLQTLRITVPPALVPEPERVARMQQDIVDKLSTIPGVRSVGFATAMPMEGLTPNWDAMSVEGKTYAADEIPPFRLFKNVSPGFFQTAGTRLIAGRDFTWTDLDARRSIVVISENLAREIWGSPSAALGKRIRQGTSTVGISQWQEVVGVVQDVRENGVHAPAPTIVYWPSTREALTPAGRMQLNVSRGIALAIRSERAGTEAFLNEMRQAVWSVNANLPLASVQTMQEIYNRSLARTSFTLVMLAIASAMALVLGVVGIYGVISYAVSQRTREIGIRLALGVQPGQLKRMFVREGLTLTAVGTAIGLAAAAGLTRVMSSLLFGTSALDPVTYVAVPAVLVIAALAASYFPARRAAAVDPVEALRAE
jgi:predicted permease